MLDVFYRNRTTFVKMLYIDDLLKSLSVELRVALLMVDPLC